MRREALRSLWLRTTYTKILWPGQAAPAEISHERVENMTGRVAVIDFAEPTGNDVDLDKLSDPAVLLANIRFCRVAVPAGQSSAMQQVRQLAVFALDPSDQPSRLIGELYRAIYHALGHRSAMKI